MLSFFKFRNVAIETQSTQWEDPRLQVQAQKKSQVTYILYLFDFVLIFSILCYLYPLYKN